MRFAVDPDLIPMAGPPTLVIRAGVGTGTEGASETHFHVAAPDEARGYQTRAAIGSHSFTAYRDGEVVGRLSWGVDDAGFEGDEDAIVEAFRECVRMMRDRAGK